MARKGFNPNGFLTQVGKGRTALKFRKNQVIFRQGDPSDAVFFLQAGRIRLTVASTGGKEAIIALVQTAVSSARDA